MADDRSVALPYERRPAALDGTAPGDYGFDPAGFTSNPPKTYLYGGEDRSLKWYQESEIVHGRIAQLAVVGLLFPSLYHFPGNPDFGVAADAYAELNPFKALSTVPASAIGQIVLGMFVVELFRIQRTILGDKKPGDLGLGQGGFNPFGFKYTDEEYFVKQEQEIKHGRLAMIASLGMLVQTNKFGINIPQQLAEAFSVPDERAILVGPSDLADFIPRI